MKKNHARFQRPNAAFPSLSTESRRDFPHTEEHSSTFNSVDCVTNLPVRVVSFAGALPRFPVLRTSMILTAAITFATLQWFNPPVAQVALRPAPADYITSSPSPSPTLTQSKDPRPSFLPKALDPVSALHEAAEPESVRLDNKQGVFLTASSVGRRKFLEETIKNVVDAGGTSLTFDVKGAAVLFHSAAPLATEVGLVKPSYDLQEVVKLAHDNGLYAIGRFVAIKDSGLTSKLPATRVRNPKTGAVISTDWVDPSDETAIRYNAEVMCEIAASGIDEVNLDYIRFSTAQFGALKVYSGQEKADRVEKFIIAMREAIDRCGPSTNLGLSTYAILGWSYDINVATLGQDVRRFAPLVDVISPMAYPATFTSPEYYIPGKNKGSRMYYLVYRTLTGYAELLGPEHAKKIRPWIQGYSVSAKDVSDQIRAVYDAGFCGFQVWNAGNNYGQTYKAMDADVLMPEHCKGA